MAATFSTYKLWIVPLVFFALTARSCVGQEPRFPGAGPTVDVSVSYAYLSAQVPTQGRIAEQGVSSSLTIAFARQISARAEGTYTRNYGAFGWPRHNDELAYLAGPVFYPLRHQRFAVYGETLFGMARIVGVISNGGPSGISGGMVNHFAWSAGGGSEMRLSRSIAARTGVDYVHGNFFVSDGTIHGQGSIRITVGLVYTFGKSR